MVYKTIQTFCGDFIFSYVPELSHLRYIHLPGSTIHFNKRTMTMRSEEESKQVDKHLADSHTMKGYLPLCLKKESLRPMHSPIIDLCSRNMDTNNPT